MLFQCFIFKIKTGMGLPKTEVGFYCGGMGKKSRLRRKS